MSDQTPTIEITPEEVQAKLARGEKFAFVDVREKWNTTRRTSKGRR